MNRPITWSGLVLALLLVSACSSVSDTRPEVIRTSERYLEQGVEAYNNSDYPAATDFFSRALASYRSIDNLDGILFSHINLAETAIAAGSYDALRKQLSDAERVIRALGASEHEPRLTLLWAQSHWRQGRRENALELLEPLLPRFNDKQEVGGKLDALALTALMLRTDIAFASLDENDDEARLWLRRLENGYACGSEVTPQHKARLLRFQAQWLMHQGEPAGAEERLQQALDIYRPEAVRPAIAATLEESARVAIQLEQWEQAEDRLLRALYIRVWILDRIGSAEVLDRFGEMYLAQGRREAADEAAEWSRHIREDDATDWRNLSQQYLQRPLVSR
ncbi:MAG TPA: tetratricopeptide repeat protein [Gammaproteobacteria bacterium]